ncbi:hypothetical protein [Porphyromonas sp.]|uniref:hypothetical protein n=1 Tax=Porphyromonas sp. TaxID=1924944 RepID=UPI003A8D1DC6
MAKYNTICSKCGKEYEVELFGKHVDRERKLEWLKDNGRCPECYKQHIRDTADNKLIIREAREKGRAVIAIDSPISYEIKDNLKELGYRWDGYFRRWYKPVPDVTPEEQMEWAMEECEKLSQWNFRIPDESDTPLDLLKSVLG